MGKMIEIKTKLRKWGNSLGIVVPQKALNSKFKEGDEVSVFLRKEREVDFRDIFGALKGWRIDAQKVKDELRKEEFEIEKRKWKEWKV